MTASPSDHPHVPLWKLGGAVLLAPLFVVGALTYGHDPVAHEATLPLTHREQDFVGATACESCHPDHHASWQRTWHATMTQAPTRDAVQGAFDGKSVTFDGRSAKPFTQDGKFYFDLPGPRGRRTAEVALVVGSHRYQQYFERSTRGSGAAYLRLPLLWHMEDQRWLHIHGVFLDPDGATWDGEPAIWNENCIFCHNTGPMPGMKNLASRPGFDAKEFDSHVANLGISCESCHGPGGAHVDAMRDPLARYAAYGDDKADLQIHSPHEMSKEESVSACGQCHGQRLPKPIQNLARYLETGPTFRAGDRLTDHVHPLTQDEVPDPSFRLRFWPDGTPRLTAYEYQGVVASPCYQHGTMTCNSCHSMHAGDVDGNLLPAMRTNRACTQCHEEIGRAVAAHTRHGAASSGSKCTSCHMPHMVYGVLGVRISHRIENPDPHRDGAQNRPNACTLCHLDKSLSWAAAATREMFGTKFEGTAARAGLPPTIPDSVGMLLAGDPVQRAVYAHALGRTDAAPGERAEGTVALLTTLGGSYASVRTIARRSLLAREAQNSLGLTAPITAIDPANPPRPDAVRGLLQSFPQSARGKLRMPQKPSILMPGLQPSLSRIVSLLNQQSTKTIRIGE